MTSERLAIVSLGNLVFINVYFPANGNDRYDIISDILDDISGIIGDIPNAIPVFGGGLNTNLHMPSLITDCICAFMSIHSLSLCDDRLFTSSNNVIPSPITYSHSTLNHGSYIDFILFPKNVYYAFVEYSILDHPLNLSDHHRVCVSC